MEPQPFEICSYRPAYKDAFKAINKGWLEKHFYVETFDEEVLSNPEKYLLEKGGEIFFAVKNGEAIGTVGIMISGDMLEITKMGVVEEFRNLGVGKALFVKALEHCQKLPFKKVDIFTNTKLKKAFRLYRNYGFSEIPFDDRIYKRCNSRLERYQDKNFNAEEMQVLFSEYLQRPKELEELLAEIDSKALTYKPTESSWSILDQLNHLVDAEAYAFARIKKMIAEPGSTVFPWNKDAWVERASIFTEINSALDSYKSLRKLNLELFKSANPAAFKNEVFVGDGTKFNLLDFFLLYKNHSHFGQIKRNWQDFKAQ